MIVVYSVENTNMGCHMRFLLSVLPYMLAIV